MDALINKERTDDLDALAEDIIKISSEGEKSSWRRYPRDYQNLIYLVNKIHILGLKELEEALLIYSLEWIQHAIKVQDGKLTTPDMEKKEDTIRHLHFDLLNETKKIKK